VAGIKEQITCRSLHRENFHLYPDANYGLRQHGADLGEQRCAPYFASMTQAKVTLWYDGACPLCVAEIKMITRLDKKHGRIAVVDLMGEGTCPLDRGVMLSRFHAQEAGRPIVSGAAAFGAMWRQVTPFQPLGWLALFPPALWVMEKAYVQFLRMRPRLQAWMRRRLRAA
jgi:predicted DCC family thiol-disulfide oxidoreductase YuxK